MVEQRNPWPLCCLETFSLRSPSPDVETAPDEKVLEPVQEQECESIPEPVQQVGHESQPAVRIRPQRTRKRPEYLEDYAKSKTFMDCLVMIELLCTI